MAKVMYPQYLSFSLQQFGAKFGQLRMEMSFTTFLVPFSTEIIQSGKSNLVAFLIIPDK